MLKLASVLEVSLQWFLSGTNWGGDELRDVAFQLRELGIVDLHVEKARVPGAFRRNEEVVALALAGVSPPARIIEAMPAVLAWNTWNTFLLRTFSRGQGRQVEARIGWLADIALTIHESQGFPGGCPAQRVLETYREHVSPTGTIDNFQYSDVTNLPPVSRRWMMHYPAPLSAFRARAEHLVELRERNW